MKMEAFGDCECPGCDSFAHEPSFTHDAIMDLCPWLVSIPPRSADLCQYTYHELAYVLGLDPPHYPVPAIRIEFDLLYPIRYELKADGWHGYWIDTGEETDL